MAMIPEPRFARGGEKSVHRSGSRKWPNARRDPSHGRRTGPGFHQSERSVVSSRARTRKQPTFDVGLEYTPIRVIGQGAFGVVYCANRFDGTIVAVKKVRIDPRYKNRELQILTEVNSRYVVRLLDCFKTSGPSEGTYLNLVMDYLPESLHEFNMRYRKLHKYPPLLYVKLFAFQMFAGLSYLHSKGITHRDVKPQNMLVDQDTGELRLCDLGSAKRLIPNEQSVSYIASRYCRAPELILDCVFYTPAIDIWAAGCCIAEMLTAGTPLFIGDSSTDQLQLIDDLLGSPAEEDMNTFQHSLVINTEMQPCTTLEQKLPRHTPPDLLDLLRSILIYSPVARPTAKDCVDHSTFDELFDLESAEMPTGKPFPILRR
jgi:glycogen synthase kinase 3 beta